MLVEWGELVAAILPADRVVVSLRLDDDDDDSRVIDVSAQGSEPQCGADRATVVDACSARLGGSLTC